MSCCSEDITLVGAGELIAIQEKFTREVISTVSGEFVLLNEMEINIASNLIQNPFINELQATTCGEVFLNEIDPSSLMVIVDKAFDFNGQSIAAGADLLEIDGVLNDIGTSTIFIEFTEDFVSSADFLNELYTFELKFATSDSRSYSNSIALQMEI